MNKTENIRYQDNEIIVPETQEECAFQWIDDNYQNPDFKGRPVILGSQELNYIFYNANEVVEEILTEGTVKSEVYFEAGKTYPETNGTIFLSGTSKIDATLEYTDATPEFGGNKQPAILLDKNFSRE